jgi:hypothetical protein
MTIKLLLSILVLGNLPNIVQNWRAIEVAVGSPFCTVDVSVGVALVEGTLINFGVFPLLPPSTRPGWRDGGMAGPTITKARDGGTAGLEKAAAGTAARDRENRLCQRVPASDS